MKNSNYVKAAKLALEKLNEANEITGVYTIDWIIQSEEALSDAAKERHVANELHASGLPKSIKLDIELSYYGTDEADVQLTGDSTVIKNWIKTKFHEYPISDKEIDKQYKVTVVRQRNKVLNF